VELSRDVLASYDCVLLATDHDRFDYELIKAASRLIVDSRGRYLAPDEHIVKA
jgi:UDP-N-acetyl-D-glucosamine dehydrogenase